MKFTAVFTEKLNLKMKVKLEEISTKIEVNAI